MLREYQFTLIASTQLPDDAAVRLQKKYEELMCADGGQLLDKEDWGNRRMVFPIDKQFRGRYVNYHVLTQPEVLAEAERLMRIDESVLRYMSVRVGKGVVADPEARKKEIAKRHLEFEKARAAEGNKVRGSRS